MKTWLPILIYGILMSSYANAATDIAFGTLKAVKVYDFSNDKSIKLYFDDNSTYVNGDCSLVAKITYSKHEKESIDRMLSIALSAQMAGRKVRVTSETATCEVDFIALQDARF